MDGPRIELRNFTDVGTLPRLVTAQGKILPKRTTKVTSQFQRRLGQAVKRARYLALLPYVQNHDR
jgi:small subunit ribosomal protein S18